MPCSGYFLLDKPLSVVRSQLVVADVSSFQTRKDGNPLAQFAGNGRDGEAEFGPHAAEVGVVWCRPGVGDLAVDFPGCVAFEAAHDFAFALALGGAFGHVLLCPLARAHPDQDDLVQGVVGVAVAASTEPVAGCLAG